MKMQFRIFTPVRQGRICVSWRLENGQLKVEKQIPAGIVEL